LAKLHAARQIRLCSRLGVRLAGAGGIAWADSETDGDDQWALRLCAGTGLSIGGGTDEIVKNSVADVVLGLPREPAVDRKIPFNQLARNG
jgi:hypothetical protein